MTVPTIRGVYSLAELGRMWRCGTPIVLHGRAGEEFWWRYRAGLDVSAPPCGTILGRWCEAILDDVITTARREGIAA